MHIFDQFEQAAKTIYTQAADDERIVHNPGPDRLRRISLQEPDVFETVYGNLVAITEPTSRAKPFTRNN
ncbi:MAG: hypothetical protein ACLGQW_10020, partial [Acidobacteriota bacterium]